MKTDSELSVVHVYFVKTTEAVTEHSMLFAKVTEAVSELSGLPALPSPSWLSASPWWVSSSVCFALVVSSSSCSVLVFSCFALLFTSFVCSALVASCYAHSALVTCSAGSALAQIPSPLPPHGPGPPSLPLVRLHSSTLLDFVSVCLWRVCNPLLKGGTPSHFVSFWTFKFSLSFFVS